uniref:F-ATPase protein 6 n=1 Tax=Ruditapes philippinarum TaxID=129788 RepID=Q7YF44_RUDPH|nr:ATP synthase subunit 6 [Ruditapes philippinarum]
MSSDLFSMFDCVWGSSGVYMSVSLWGSALLLVFFCLSCLVYFYNLSTTESFIMAVFDEAVNLIPKNAKAFPGVAHLIMTLYMVLFPTCVIGYCPYSFSLGSQIAVTTAISFPFFFMTLGLNFTTNWRLSLIKMVYDGSHFSIKLLVVVSELVGLVLRPFTLAIRMSLNLAVGSMMMKIFCSLAVGLLLPFSYSVFAFGGPVVLGVLSFFFSLLFSAIELVMGLLQSVIFTMLVVFYCGDALVKPE